MGRPVGLQRFGGGAGGEEEEQRREERGREDESRGFHGSQEGEGGNHSWVPMDQRQVPEEDAKELKHMDFFSAAYRRLV